MSGYTLSHRDKWQNPVFRNLLEAGIWSWMCDTAAWKDTRVRFGGKLISLKRGQIVVSERFISEGFSLGRQAVRTFLENIENDHMITREANHRLTIITICNYAKYQIEENTANPQDIPIDNPTLTQPQPKGNPNKNEGNKGNKERNNTNACVREPEKIELENLSFEHIEPWLLQQETRAAPITIDVREELERFKTHFLSYGGKDKNGNSISDWVAKLGSWLLNSQKQQNFGDKNEKIKRGGREISGGSDRVQSLYAGNNTGDGKPTWTSEGHRLAAKFLAEGAEGESGVQSAGQGADQHSSFPHL